MKTIFLYSLKIKIRNNTTFSVYRINEKYEEFLGSFVIYPDGSDSMSTFYNQIDDDEWSWLLDLVNEYKKN